MDRISEKVRDIVDVRPEVGLINFVDDPLRTLSGYHFTDATSDLMSKWLGRMTQVTHATGHAMALAGFRGVGKSHFLGAFGSILDHPEFRARLTDPLVFSKAQSLSRRNFPVAFARRGLQVSLLDELKTALSPIIGCDSDSMGESINAILARAGESTTGTPLVILIDTAVERNSRVSRDDGPVLAEIAETCKTLGIFVGVALDDDISGADGANSSISDSFEIDYLDQEHLYKIVDTHIFPKQNQSQPVLHKIYEYYRSSLSGFRWSEDRFKKLYPLHPAIMEIAPFVRLYMHEFALLTFASEAGSRILGRPATSLIAPDEVFDKAEDALRRVDELKDVFVEFDRLNTEIVVKAPMSVRLQARLILKGLFLFSLNDEGATAAEIGASMLIYDETRPDKAQPEIETFLLTYSKASPQGIRVQTDKHGKNRYSFKLGGKDDVKRELAAAAIDVPLAAVNDILKRSIDDRYSDSSLGTPHDGSDSNTSECFVTWRGGLRRGRVSWLDGASLFDSASHGPVDWLVVINLPDSGVSELPRSDAPIVTWTPAALTDEESDTLRRYHVLNNDLEFRRKFQNHIAAAIQFHAIAVERIFQRAFIDEGVLTIEGFHCTFTDETRSATSLSEVFSIMLESMFEGRFPLHPHFSQIMRFSDVSMLVTDLFGGARPNSDDVQRMAEDYGLPLGIVAMSDAGFVQTDPELLLREPLVRLIFDSLEREKSDVVTLDTIFESLESKPFGLVREAAYLLLSALVAARLLEFVTSNGDRISHRSLDLTLIWDDIIGITVPSESVHSNKRLSIWVSLLTGHKTFNSLARTKDRQVIFDALKGWLADWNSKALSTRFEMVPDDAINTAIWRRAARSIKVFGSIANLIGSVHDDSTSVEACLNRVADVFSDSEIEFARHSADLATAEHFIAGASLRREIISWLSLCEAPVEDSIDGSRKELYLSVQDKFFNTSEAVNVELANQWERFRKLYSDYFIERHDATVFRPYLQERLAEIQKTDLWWEFENLSGFELFDPRFQSESKRILRAINRLNCNFDTRKMLERAPACGCSFTLGDDHVFDDLPDKLWKTVTQGLASYRELMISRESELRSALDTILARERDIAIRQAGADLSAYLSREKNIRRLSDLELRLLERSFAAIDPNLPDRPTDHDHGRATSWPILAEPPDFSEAGDELEGLLDALHN